MRTKLLSGLLAGLSCVGIAQQSAAKILANCYKDKSVDEYIAELNKRQKGSRNPLPNDICIFGMCSHSGLGPTESSKQKSPEAPKQKPATGSTSASAAGDESSSKNESAELAETLPADASQSGYDPITAAHEVDVGDYYF